jgi:hypothetical protein
VCGRNSLCRGTDSDSWKELTLQKELLSVRKKLTLKRELLSVGTHFKEGVTVCVEGTHLTEGPTLTVGRNSHYRGSYSMWGKELTLQRQLLSVGNHFTEGVTLFGKEHTLQTDRLCLWELTVQRELLPWELTLQRGLLSVEKNSLYRRTVSSCEKAFTLQRELLSVGVHAL